jgi:hypothetical protein
MSIAIPSLRSPTREQLVDEFGQLSRANADAALTPQIAKYLRDAKREADLAKTIRGWYEQHPADQPAIVDGLLYQVLVDARGEERVFGPKAKAKIFSQLKAAKAWQIFTVTLKAVESNPAIAALISLATKEPIGSRKLTLVAKPAQVAEAA